MSEIRIDPVYAEATNPEAGTVDRYDYPPGWPLSAGLPPSRRYLTCAKRVPGLLFFRVFGFGLHVKDLRRHPPIFAERAARTWAYRHTLTLGPWRLRVLHPWDSGRR